MYTLPCTYFHSTADPPNIAALRPGKTLTSLEVKYDLENLIWDLKMCSGILGSAVTR